MSKKSKRTIGLMAIKVSDLKEGKLTGGLFLKGSNWRKVNDGNANVSKVFVDGDWNNVLTFNGETYDGNTLVSGIEY